MTPSSLYAAIREDSDRKPFEGEVVATDADVADSPSRTFSDEEMLPVVFSAADAVAEAVRAQHVPGRVASFSADGGRLSSTLLRLLPSRVYDDADKPLLRVSIQGYRRRPRGARVYAVDDGRIYAPAGSTYEGIVSVEGDEDEPLLLPEYLEQAVVLHACATLAASRQEGRAVTYRNAFLRAVAPYARQPDETMGRMVVESEAAP